MLALLLPTLFAAAACFALGVIASSWRSHGAAALALHRQPGACGRTRELRFRLVSTSVCTFEERPDTKVFRVNFGQPAAGRPSLATAQPELRAAA